MPIRSAVPGRKSQAEWLPILALVAIHLLLLSAWPAYRQVAGGGAQALAHSLFHKGGVMEKGRFFSGSSEDQKLDPPSESLLAQHALSMEFRFRHLHVDPSLLQEWSTEWKPDTPSQKRVMLSFLLSQLPESTAQKDPLAQKKLLDCILEITSDGRRTSPENAIFWIAESLATFYSGQETTALEALKGAAGCARSDVSLRELNHSQRALWNAEKKPWTLFSVTPRAWSLEFHRTLHAFSRMISSRERTGLKKYNLEQAVGLCLLHIEMATQIAEAGWTASDAAVARAIANRAMEPFWTQRGVNPTDAQLEKHFANLLEDQGDKTLLVKFRSRIDQIAARDEIVLRLLPVWRRVQQLASWNAPGILACLLLQTASLLLTWGTVAFFTPPSAKVENSPKVSVLPPSLKLQGAGSPQPSAFCPQPAILAFAVAPIGWMVSNWPSGGVGLMLSLVGSWLLWWGLLRMDHQSEQTGVWKASLASAAILMLVTTLLTTTGLSIIFEYQAGYLDAILQQGWR